MGAIGTNKNVFVFRNESKDNTNKLALLRISILVAALLIVEHQSYQLVFIRPSIAHFLLLGRMGLNVVVNPSQLGCRYCRPSATTAWCAARPTFRELVWGGRSVDAIEQVRRLAACVKEETQNMMAQQ